MLIPMKIIELATDATSGHNDGWTKKAAQNELSHIAENTKDRKIKQYIEGILKRKKTRV